MNKTLKKTLSIIIAILMIVSTMPFAFAANVNLVINMTDSIADGWSGNAIQVGTLSGGVFTKIADATVNSGKTATYEAVISDESAYAFKWTKGWYARECSFSILIDGETVFEASTSDCSNYATVDLIYIWCNHNVTDSNCSKCGQTCGVDFAHTAPEAADCTKGYACTVCEQPVEAVDSHTAPETFDCTKGYACTVCGQTMVEAVDAHNFEDGACKVCGITGGYCGASTNDVGAESVKWTLDSTGVLTISGTGAMADYDYDESPFYENSDITTVVIEDGVTSIGNFAFAVCASLANIKIGNSVTSIGNYAFYDCRSLESMEIPDSVTSIGDWAFSCCESLESIEIPDSVTSIGYYAFQRCRVLENITVDEDNEYYSSENGVLFNKDKTTLIQYPLGNTETLYTIPDSVTSIGKQAFRDCTNLKSVTIPDGVTSIGDYAFYNCTSLTLVHYLGTSEQWDEIEIGSSNNNKLTDATRHYCTEKEATVTCTEEGYAAGWYCADCEEYVVGHEETAALGHDYDVTKSENNLTRPIQNDDDTWTDGYYTYTCKNGCGSTTTETAKRADYTDFDTAMNDYNAIVNDETVLDSVKNELLSIYQQNADVTGGDRIETEQAEVDAVVRLLSEKIDEIKAGIEDGTAIKADYTAIDEAIAAIDEALKNATISEEMANELVDIKADLAELKADVNSSKADVAELLTRAEAIAETMDNCANGTHSFTDYTESAEAKCGVAGKEEATCDNGCGATDENAIPALEHVDKDGDYVCDNRCGYEFEKPVDPTPDTPDEPTDNNCDHLCHSDNAFIQFVWKIISFLQRLFGIQQYCDCGVLHYDNPVFG